jgi:hypothetical protein
MTKQPNPNDPSLVDVYDDAGNYITSLPADTSAIEQVADPMTGAVTPPTDPAGASDIRAPVQAVGRALEVPALASAGAPPARQGTTEVTARAGERPLDPGAADSMPSPAEADAEMFRLEPGAADMFPGTAGGWQDEKRQTSGMSPEAVSRYGQDIEDLADQERGAALDEALARETQLMEDEKRQLELEREVKQKQAEQAIEQKQIFARRAKVENLIATVANQEPDRHRAFPTGFGAVATFIGAIAGGMLQGLNGGGSNPTLDALMHRLDEDVRQQRLTQSEQLKDLTRQLGSIDAAEDMLRAKQKEVVLKETEARLLGSQNKVAPAQIDAFRKRMNAEISRHRIDALTKLERDMTIQEANAPGSAPTPVDAESYRARSLQQYATENGVPPKEAHKAWTAYNKEFKERATLRAGLDTADRLIDKFEQTGDVAGLGPMAKFIPSSVNTQDAKAVRQVLGSVTAQYLKAISGAAVTEQEYARTIENLQGPGDYDSVKRGLGILRQSVSAADEESQVDNPTFFRLRRELRDMTRGGAVRGQDGRAQQEGAAGSPVAIPKSSRIAYEHQNPGNLTFAGQAGATRGEPKKGGGYWAKFEDAGAGMRALARQVQLDQSRGLNVRQFVEKYAPSSDGNHVENYLAKLQRLTGADEATPLSEMSAGHLAYAIAAIESGTRPNK